jgi:hypothetical protein
LRGVLAWAGIAAQAGIWPVADADQLAAAGQAAGWLRILVEIIDVPAGEAFAAADEVLHRRAATASPADPENTHNALTRTRSR